MFAKLLVPLDGSELSASVLTVVEKLVRDTDAEVILLAVGEGEPATEKRRRSPSLPVPIASGAITYGNTRSVLPDTEPSYVESRGQVIDRVADELAASLDGPKRTLSNAGVRVLGVTSIGPPAREIIDCARRQGADAIVMATHGRAGLSKALHGSVTAAVIHSGVVPVLVVRPRPQ